MKVPPLPTKPGIYIVEDYLHEDAIIYRLYSDGWTDEDANPIDPRDLPRATFRRLVIAPEDVKTKSHYKSEMLDYLQEHGVDASKASVDYDFTGYKEVGGPNRVLWPDGFDVAHFDRLWRGSMGHFDEKGN